jgi:cytochrome c oxidase subunit 2
VSFSSIVLQIPPTRSGWEHVYNLYSYLGVAASVVTFAIIAYFCVRYRSNSKSLVSASDARTHEIRDSKWKGPMLVCLLMGIVLIAVASQSFSTYDAFSTAPSSPTTLHINVVAHQFAWTFTYPNGYVSEDVAIVPTDTVVVFNVTSRDVYHQFGIPYFRVKTDAIPGRTNAVWIQTTYAGNFTVQCFELCGAGHATMIGKLSVVDPATFALWYASTSTTSPGGGT